MQVAGEAGGYTCFLPLLSPIAAGATVFCTKKEDKLVQLPARSRNT